MKVCSKCKIEKDDFDFSSNRNSPDGLHSVCRTCARATNKVWHTKSTAPKDTLRKYGICKWEYELLLEKQKGLCKICEQADTKRLSVDHCHKTHKIRGLLCGNCNRGLGLFKDNPRLLERAIKYLLGEL